MSIGVFERPVSPAEFAVRFGLEPADVEWLMQRYERGMGAQQVSRELQLLGCTQAAIKRLLELIVEATAGLA
jgi:hypothetical protein